MLLPWESPKCESLYSYTATCYIFATKDAVLSRIPGVFGSRRACLRYVGPRTSAHACGPHGLQTPGLTREMRLSAYRRLYSDVKTPPGPDPKTPGIRDGIRPGRLRAPSVEIVHPSTAPANNRRAIYRARPETGSDHTDPWHAHDPPPSTWPSNRLARMGWDGGGGGGGAGGAGRRRRSELRSIFWPCLGPAKTSLMGPPACDAPHSATEPRHTRDPVM